MRGDFDGELRRRMEEASMLPHDHPKRQEACEEIAQAGRAAQEEWLRLQAEQDKLRVALRDVAPPVALKQRVLEIPSNIARRRRRVRVPLGAVAAFLAIALIIAVMSVPPSLSSVDRSIARLVSLVVDDHEKRPALTVIAEDPQRLVIELQSRAPFEVRLPSASVDGTVIGGRICRFDEGPLILTRWRTGAQEISMYQIRLRDFGLPPNLPRHEIDPPDRGSDAGRCRVRLWSDDQFGYATVTDAIRPDHDF